MATDLVCGVSAYAGKKELAFGHCIASGYKGGGSGLAKEIAGG
jgi:hypothetical protein